MKRMIWIALLACAPGIATGQEPKAPGVSNYVGDTTFLIMHVDATRVTPEAVFGRLEQMIGHKAPEELKTLRQGHTEFRRFGGKDFYVLLNIGPRPQPLFVVPLHVGADSDALADLARTIDQNFRVQRDGSNMLVGAPDDVALALAQKAKNAEAQQAFGAVQGAAVKMVLLPPRPFLRAQEEVAPKLPPELGGGPITTITRGFQWAALGVDLEPKLRLKATLQATDADAAQALHQIIDKATKLVDDRQFWANALQALRFQRQDGRITLDMDEKELIATLTPALKQARAAAQRMQSSNNLKQMGLAMHNYHDVHKTFPPRANHVNGKPMLSWRVHILPYLEQDALYRQFKLDEPWDSPHNKALIAQMPLVYKSPTGEELPAGKTRYLVPVAANTIFGQQEGMDIRKITDGTSNTIMMVEAAPEKAVFWTQPEDFKVNDDNPGAGLTPKGERGFLAAYADGSVHYLLSTLDPQVLRALFSADGGEVVPRDAIR